MTEFISEDLTLSYKDVYEVIMSPVLFETSSIFLSSLFESFLAPFNVLIWILADSFNLFFNP